MANDIGYNGLSTNISGSGSNNRDDFFEVGRAVQESISKITILANAKEQEILHRLDSDYKSFARGIKSALNDTSYFREGVKAVDPSTGRSFMEYYVQTSELQNAMSALRSVNGRLSGTSYEIRPPQQMDYITGTRSFEGRQAQAKAQYEIGRRGGKLLASPTLDNPDLYTYMLPFSSDWATGVAQDAYLNAIFTESDALSNLEHSKRASEAEIDLNYAKARKAEMIKKLSASQAKEAGNVWESFEKEQSQQELKAMKDNYALSKQMRMMDELSASQAKEAGGVWAEFEAEESMKQRRDSDVEYATWKKVRGENAQKDKERQREEDKKKKDEERQQAKDALSSRTKRLFILGQVISMFTVLLDLTRRILTASLERASEAKRTEAQARNIGSSYSSMLDYNYADKAYGLKEGTTAGAIFNIQKMFGDPANLDTGALAKLAMVMGNSVGDAVRSGLGGKKPEALMEMIMDAFLKAQQAGVNQFGEQVGQEEARRNLYTLLSEISPEIALLFSRAVEANSFGIHKGEIETWQDYLNANKRIQGNMDDQSLKAFTTLGEVVDQVKAKFSNLVNLISTNFLLNLGNLIDKINNADWGKSGEEKITDKEEIQKKLKARQTEISQLMEARKDTMTATLGEFGAMGSFEQIMSDVDESPDFWNSAYYPPEVKQRIQANKKAVANWYTSNALAKGMVVQYLTYGKVLGDITNQLRSEKPEYNWYGYSDEGITQEAKFAVSTMSNPTWTDNYFTGVSTTGFWEMATGEEKYLDKVSKLNSLMQTQNPMEVARFMNAYNDYMNKFASTEGTKENMDFAKAMDILYKNYEKSTPKHVRKSRVSFGEDEINKQLAFILLLHGDVKKQGHMAEQLYGVNSVIAGVNQNDLDTIANYYGKFLTEQGANAIGNLTNAGFTIEPQAGATGVFTLKFEADVNGEKLTQEYKNIQLRGKYTEGIEYTSDSTGARLNTGAVNSSN